MPPLVAAQTTPLLSWKTLAMTLCDNPSEVV
jgi:hypothetical protein